MSGTRLNRNTADQGAGNIIPPKKKQRQEHDRDVGQNNVKDRIDDKKNNVSF
jgi:hypothetical protein